MAQNSMGIQNISEENQGSEEMPDQIVPEDKPNTPEGSEEMPEQINPEDKPNTPEGSEEMPEQINPEDKPNIPEGSKEMPDQSIPEDKPNIPDGSKEMPEQIVPEDKPNIPEGSEENDLGGVNSTAVTYMTEDTPDVVTVGDVNMTEALTARESLIAKTFQNNVNASGTMVDATVEQVAPELSLQERKIEITQIATPV